TCEHQLGNSCNWWRGRDESRPYLLTVPKTLVFQSFTRVVIIEMVMIAGGDAIHRVRPARGDGR
ncbi:MAG: hypothetical protein ACI3YC_07820, partial [Alloprevotella sp.]